MKNGLIITLNWETPRRSGYAEMCKLCCRQPPSPPHLSKFRARAPQKGLVDPLFPVMGVQTNKMVAQRARTKKSKCGGVFKCTSDTSWRVKVPTSSLKISRKADPKSEKGPENARAPVRDPQKAIFLTPGTRKKWKCRDAEKIGTTC